MQWTGHGRNERGSTQENQRLAWEQKATTTSRLQEKGKKVLLPVSKAGVTWRKLKTRRADWRKQQMRCFHGPLVFQFPKQREWGASPAPPPFCPPISCQVPQLPNPARTCWPRSLGRKEACQGQLLTMHSREGRVRTGSAGKRSRISRNTISAQVQKWWWRKRRQLNQYSPKDIC